ncbi:MAG: multicopper oxidase domain-containing protein [Candidatus Krumholzibacteria bacterium]|nr:multicopper oxidase domain-containing protein [Candidatus Krumholzibacteria bacterium]MDH5268710.1 multicopper oxidase domain-containing protein [Candidatus Krumholzibacteria bacterium]
MRTRSAVAILATVLGVVSLSAVSTFAQYPGKNQLPIAPTAIPKFVDPLPHFAGARVDATQPGTPLTVELMSLDQQALSTGTVLGNGTVVGNGAGLTHVWGYRVSNGAVTRGPLWPSFTIEAKRGVPLDVLYLNSLNESYDAVNIAVDQTLHWAMGTHSMDLYTGDVPATVHLHGGEVPAWSDGGPDSWFTPSGLAGGHAAQTNVYHYPNTQEAATLWYHDHALGATRLNVYAGTAGFYFLRDNAEDALHLPGWSGDGKVQEFNAATGTFGAAYLPEIEIAIQDRMFDTNGQLYWPAGGPFGMMPPNPTVHPYWTPEFIGDIITVNGKTWPYLSVAPRKYRFRLLNGSNARFYELWLQDLASGTMGPTIYQVGTDGGLLDTPVAIAGKLLIAPGERADLVIDFSQVTSPSGVWTLKNSGNAPYPKGTPPKGSTLGQIMQFRVDGGLAGADNSVITGRTTPMVKLANFLSGTPAVPVNKQRQLTLNEVMGPGGPLEVLVNNTKWAGHSTRPYNDFTMDPSGTSNTMYSEITQEGQTEVWQIINMTADAHPIHLHLVQFQLLSRQKFNTNRYAKVYNSAFVAAGFPLGFEGGWGPPLNYGTGNDPAGTNWTPFLGGNPDVTPHLQGMPKPTLPNEMGWKDTFIMYPGEVTTVIARWAPTDAPAAAPANSLWFDFNPNGGHGYVWHCHIIDHEDNEMMRPYLVTANTNAPGGRNTSPFYLGYYNTHPAAAALASFSPGSMDDGGAAPRTSGLPTAYSLGQNTPNPFNPTTQIRFALPAESRVSLVVYNVAGQKVATLIDDTAPAGYHTVELDAANLASGVYFYRLDAGNFSQTRKMVLLK